MDETNAKKQSTKRKTNKATDIKDEKKSTKKPTAKNANTKQTKKTTESKKTDKKTTSKPAVKKQEKTTARRVETTKKTKKTETKPKTEKKTENKKEKVTKKKKEIIEDVVDEEISENIQENSDIVAVEEKIDEIGKNIKEKHKIPKKDRKEMRKKYLPNLIIAFVLVVYYGLISLGFYKIESNVFITDLKTFGMLILLVAILLFENAYSKKNKVLAVHGIEGVFIAVITIALIYIYLKLSAKFVIITLSIALIFTIYYIFKYIILRRIFKNNYFKNKMKEIIEKDEDVK